MPEEFSVEESRAKRAERLKARFRARGGIFVPAQHNALMDILLSRGVDGESPSKARRRKSSMKPTVTPLPALHESIEGSTRKYDTLMNEDREEGTSKRGRKNHAPASVDVVENPPKATRSKSKAGSRTTRKSEVPPVSEGPSTSKAATSSRRTQAKKKGKGQNTDVDAQDSVIAHESNSRTKKVTAKNHAPDEQEPQKHAKNAKKRPRPPIDIHISDDDKPTTPPKRPKADRPAPKSKLLRQATSKKRDPSPEEGSSSDVPLVELVRSARSKGKRKADNSDVTSDVRKRAAREALCGLGVEVDDKSKTGKVKRPRTLERDADDSQNGPIPSKKSQEEKTMPSPQDYDDREQDGRDEPSAGRKAPKGKAKAKVIVSDFQEVVEEAPPSSSTASAATKTVKAAKTTLPPSKKRARKEASAHIDADEEPEPVEPLPSQSFKTKVQGAKDSIERETTESARPASKKRSKKDASAQVDEELEPEPDEPPPPSKLARKKTKVAKAHNEREPSEVLADVQVHGGVVGGDERGAALDVADEETRFNPERNKENRYVPNSASNTSRTQATTKSKTTKGKEKKPQPKPKPKPRLSLFPTLEGEPDSDEDPIDFLS